MEIPKTEWVSISAVIAFLWTLIGGLGREIYNEVWVALVLCDYPVQYVDLGRGACRIGSL